MFVRTVQMYWVISLLAVNQLVMIVNELLMLYLLVFFNYF